jgi:hypothetical protein
VTLLGWIFLGLSTAFVWGLTAWCFYKVLTLPPDHDVAEPAKDFRSA